MSRSWWIGTAVYLGVLGLACVFTIASGEPLFGMLLIFLTAPASLLVVTACNLWLWPDLWDGAAKVVTMAVISGMLNVAVAWLLSRLGRSSA